MVVNVDGTNATRISDDDNGTTPDWSPYGKKIVYEGRGSINVINVDGTGATQLVADTEQPEEHVSYINPSWSPDGTKIVFVRITSDTREVTDKFADVNWPVWVGAEQAAPPVADDTTFCGRAESDFDNVLFGTNEGEVLEGTAGDDLIRGWGGNDTIYGLAGNDCLKGDDEDDAIWGGDGEDRLQGDSGKDTVNGNAGGDKLWGGDEDDTLLDVGQRR